MSNNIDRTPGDSAYYYQYLAWLGAEEWLPIPGYEGYYEVSNLGNMKSLDRVVRKKSGGTHTLIERMLKPYPDKLGYSRVHLCKNGKLTSYQVHRLVAQAFLGPAPDDKNHVCHNDGEPTNNHLENLRWDSAAGNARDRIKHGTDNKGSKNGWAKIGEQQVLEIQNLLLNTQLTQVEIAAKVSVESSTITDINRGRSWSHLTNATPDKPIRQTRKGPRKKLSDDEVISIKRMIAAADRLLKDIAADFDVDRTSISAIKIGRTYTHIQLPPEEQEQSIAA